MTILPSFQIKSISKVSKLIAVACTAVYISAIINVSHADEFDLSVNGQKIPREQLEFMFNENKSQAPEGTDLKKLVRESAIRREVLAQQAIKDGLENDPKVKLQLEMATRNFLAAAYMDRTIQKSITDKDLKDEYNRVIAEIGNRSEYQTKHILVDDEAKAAQIAKSVKANPKSFEEVAKKESKDPGSAQKGGDLGWVALGTMVPEFEKGVIETKPGQISDPIKSQFGYHIIKVDQTRKMQAPKFEDVKERIREQLTRQRAEKIINDLVAKSKIQ